MKMIHFKIDAVCHCHNGKVRRNNEDNFYFSDIIMPEVHNGLDESIKSSSTLNQRVCFAVFDGMGGEELGERASFLAAQTLKDSIPMLKEPLLSPRVFWEDISTKMNKHVCEETVKLSRGRLGTTLAGLVFGPKEVYMCNIGDSRAYRLRDNELLQLSKDHTDFVWVHNKDGRHKESGLIQFLGVFPDELTLEPYIAKGELKKGDQYLICSDGLTDMLTGTEICAILKDHRNIQTCVDTLVGTALEKGGKDNITAILCRVR